MNGSYTIIESILLITGFFTWVYFGIWIIGKTLWGLAILIIKAEEKNIIDEEPKSNYCVYHLNHKKATIQRYCDNKFLKEKDLIGNDRVHCPNCDRSILFTYSDATPCPKCGMKCDTWFSRSEPMGYYCNNCGCER